MLLYSNISVRISVRLQGIAFSVILLLSQDLCFQDVSIAHRVKCTRQI